MLGLLNDYERKKARTTKQHGGAALQKEGEVSNPHDEAEAASKSEEACNKGYITTKRHTCGNFSGTL